MPLPHPAFSGSDAPAITDASAGPAGFSIAAAAAAAAAAAVGGFVVLFARTHGFSFAARPPGLDGRARGPGAGGHGRRELCDAAATAATV